ncbi:hypothetical protein C8R44DRAFT_846820 [Mycena epipterygia]|nr:hypothetical protein C8R44DRAFT_846820 [Mycena epipterygia]
MAPNQDTTQVLLAQGNEPVAQTTPYDMLKPQRQPQMNSASFAPPRRPEHHNLVQLPRRPCQTCQYSKREYLLVQIRQKDAIIESLLKQVRASSRGSTACKPACARAPYPGSAPSQSNFASNPAFEESPDEDEGEIADDEDGAGAGSESGGGGEKLTELDDNKVGVVNTAYFMPRPGTDLGMRAQLIEQRNPPEILIHGLVVPENVDKLFEIVRHLLALLSRQVGDISDCDALCQTSAANVLIDSWIFCGTGATTGTYNSAGALVCVRHTHVRLHGLLEQVARFLDDISPNRTLPSGLNKVSSSTSTQCPASQDNRDVTIVCCPRSMWIQYHVA